MMRSVRGEVLKSFETSFRLRLFQFITVEKTISITELPLSLFLSLRNYVKDDKNMMFKVLYCASGFFFRLFDL